MVKTKKTASKDEQINSLSNLFSVLSHPARIKILWLLKKKRSINVSEIQEALKISQSNVSQHLAALKLNRLVTEERKGKEIYYSLVASKKVSRVLLSAANLLAYQLAANSELLSSYSELLSFLA